MVGTLAWIGTADSVTTTIIANPEALMDYSLENAKHDKSGLKEVLGDYASIYGGNWTATAEIMVQLAQCESSFNVDAWNRKDPHGGSKGLYQYQDRTFYSYAKVYGIKDPNVWSVPQQVKLTYFLVRDKMLYLWSCSAKIDYSKIK